MNITGLRSYIVQSYRTPQDTETHSSSSHNAGIIYVNMTNSRAPKKSSLAKKGTSINTSQNPKPEETGGAKSDDTPVRSFCQPEKPCNLRISAPCRRGWHEPEESHDGDEHGNGSSKKRVCPAPLLPPCGPRTPCPSL